jgi:hypothetical protein
MLAHMVAYEEQLQRQAVENLAALHNAAPLTDTGATFLEDELGVYRVESTQARVTLSNAVNVLQRYVSKLPGDGWGHHVCIPNNHKHTPVPIMFHYCRYTDLRPVFFTEESEAPPTFTSHVMLPAASPIRSARGTTHRNRKLAKGSAALAAIRYTVA